MKTREIAEFVGGKLIGDDDVQIERVAALDTAATGEIAFAEKVGPELSTRASCVIVPLDSGTFSCVSIEVKDPKLAFAKIAELLHPTKVRSFEIHPSAAIAGSADLALESFVGPHVSIGNNTTVGTGTQILAGAKIGDGVTIGSNCIIRENVVIDDGTMIGNGVILHAGVIVGADGYGYVRDGDRHIKFPQIGRVVIEDNVEIGANSCVDRGALGETRIGEGTKIDNLVQIAHNVQVGKRVIIAAQTGISGSTVLEDDCVIGGQVGMGDHATVKTGAIIGSQAGVLPGKIVRAGVWWGTPVQPLDEYKRQNAMAKGLGRLRDEVKELRERISGKEKS